MFTLNGIDPRVYGFTLDAAPGWRDGPTRGFQTADVPGRAGAIEVAPPTERARKVTIRGTVQGATVAVLRANLDKLAATVYAPVVALAFSDTPGRELLCRCESFAVAPVTAALVATALPVEIALVAADPPYFLDTAQTNSASLLNTGTALALGTAPVRPVVRVTAVGSTPTPGCTLTYRHADGTVLGTMTFSTALALVSGDTFVVDCAKQTALKNGVSVLHLLTAGDFFVCDPLAHGSFVAGQWPTLGRDNTTWTMRAEYRKAWR